MSPRRMVPESGCCSVAIVRISVDLPAPFGPEQAEHAGGNLERDVVEGANAVGVRLGETIDDEVHECRGWRISARAVDEHRASILPRC